MLLVEFSRNLIWEIHLRTGSIFIHVCLYITLKINYYYDEGFVLFCQPKTILAPAENYDCENSRQYHSSYSYSSNPQPQQHVTCAGNTGGRGCASCRWVTADGHCPPCLQQTSHRNTANNQQEVEGILMTHHLDTFLVRVVYHVYLQYKIV